MLFLQDNFGWSAALAGSYYSTFLMFVYFLPFIGGILADKFGYGRMVTIGISIMFLGYLLLSFPLGQRYDGDDRYHRCIGADLYGNGTVQR